MNYYFYIAHYYDEKHDCPDQYPIKVKADTAEDAAEKAYAELRKFKAEYPYKVFQNIELEHIISAAVLAAEDDHSVSGLLEEV